MGSSEWTKGVFYRKPSLKRIQRHPRELKVKMPTLEAQLSKAETSLAALEKALKIGPGWMYSQHRNNAELRGLRERVRYLQQRIEVRNERDERHEAALTLMMLAEEWVRTYESSPLPARITVPTAPE